MAIPPLEGIVMAQADGKVEVGATRRSRWNSCAFRSNEKTPPEGREQEWIAGFVCKGNLDVFRNVGCQTKGDGACLVVIDYAAAKATIASSY